MNVSLIFFCHDLIIKTQALIPVLLTLIHTRSSTTCFKSRLEEGSVVLFRIVAFLCLEGVLDIFLWPIIGAKHQFLWCCSFKRDSKTFKGFICHCMELSSPAWNRKNHWGLVAMKTQLSLVIWYFFSPCHRAPAIWKVFLGVHQGYIPFLGEAVVWRGYTLNTSTKKPIPWKISPNDLQLGTWSWLFSCCLISKCICCLCVVSLPPTLSQTLSNMRLEQMALDVSHIHIKPLPSRCLSRNQGL